MIGPLSARGQAGWDIDQTHIQDSTTVVCAVACVRTDRCSLQRMTQKTNLYPEYRLWNYQVYISLCWVQNCVGDCF